MNKTQAFDAALGRFVRVWADLEVGLDLLALSLREKIAPDRRRKISHQLSGKIEFVRQQTELLDPVQRWKPVIITLLDEIDAVSETRHDFVHGAIFRSHIGKPYVTVMMARILQPPSRKRRPPVNVTTKQLTETADFVFGLGDRMFDLVQALDREEQNA